MYKEAVLTTHSPGKQQCRMWERSRCNRRTVNIRFVYRRVSTTLAAVLVKLHRCGHEAPVSRKSWQANLSASIL